MARAAFSRLQYDEAAYHFRAAVTLHPRVPGGATNRGRLLLELARAQFRAGRVEDAWNSCEEAARTGRADGDAYLVADAAVAIRGSGPGFWTFTARQNSLCREALAMLGGADPVRETRLRAQLGSTINPWTRPLADPEGASGDGDADRDAESAFLGLQASHTRLLNVAHVLERLALADEAMALGVSSGSDEYLAWGLLWRLGALYQLGRRVELDSDLMSTAAVVDRLKEPLWTYRLLNVRSSLAILDGDYHAADRLSWDALQIAESCGLQEAVFLRCVTTSCLAMLTGAGLDEAEEQIRRLVADAPFFARGWHAELLVALGRMDEAATIWRGLAPPRRAAPTLSGMARGPRWSRQPHPSNGRPYRGQAALRAAAAVRILDRPGQRGDPAVRTGRPPPGQTRKPARRACCRPRSLPDRSAPQRFHAGRAGRRRSKG